MLDWFSIFKVAVPVIGAIAQAIIEGSRAAGVTHETVALTIAKTVGHLLNSVPQTQAPQVPAQIGSL